MVITFFRAIRYKGRTGVLIEIRYAQLNSI